MDKKLAKLERRTQEAIHTLIRTLQFSLPFVFPNVVCIGQRLAAQKGESDDLVGAMRADERAGQLEDPDEDD